MSDALDDTYSPHILSARERKRLSMKEDARERETRASRCRAARTMHSAVDASMPLHPTSSEVIVEFRFRIRAKYVPTTWSPPGRSVKAFRETSKVPSTVLDSSALAIA